MRKIIFTRPDGGLSVVTPAINSHPVREDITEAEAEQRAWDKLPTDAINPQWVDASAIPADRTFRDAWKDGGGKVVHDMNKAREIHKEELRRIRTPKLAALDVAYQRADEVGDTTEKQRIATIKQAMRDATADPAIDAAQTPEELKVVLPRVLAKESLK